MIVPFGNSCPEKDWDSFHVVHIHLNCVRLREKMDMHAESAVIHKVLSVIYKIGIVYYMRLTKIV